VKLGVPTPIHQREKLSPPATQVPDPADPGQAAAYIRRRLDSLKGLQCHRYADELASRVSPLVEPVGINEPQAVVVGAFNDGLKKGFVLRHLLHPDFLVSRPMSPQ
jgi:hypothetical protein